MARKTTRRVWTVVYQDARDIAGAGVAHFDDGSNAAAFAMAHEGTVNEEDVPARIADRWTFTRWVAP
jgi:hypothetical protein